MIVSLEGTVAHVGLDHVVLETGGVGRRVLVPPQVSAELRTGQPARLATSLVVREDSMTLYGFLDDDTREVFETVQSVSGVGPRLALALVAVLSPAELARAVAAEDLAALTSVPGIGKKGAQRLVLELAGKLPAVPVGAEGEVAVVDPAPTAAADGPAWAGQVREALEGLGWNTAQATRATDAVVARHEGDDPVPALPELLREALREASS
ncbi:Holliday junction branch migration protein RuvA [Kytococcus schroeteri]|uniref:Holliday junction branch migration complex subunit RuvA n=2 Tax=Kytococcus TaxID=57499 RepID=A0A2I1PDM6_9MICO|nr:Holliday junction branch migration protein RuvA [Kytococcus schroeteri]PKZ42714.1 Holliday junction branch migration protein RuvA [Kytococcus schroeteri]